MGVRYGERCALRDDLLVRQNALLAADHDPVVGADPLAHDAQALDQRAELHRAPLRNVVVPDDVDEASGLIGGNRLVGEQKRLIVGRALQAHAGEHAWREQPLRVGHNRAGAQGARAGVEPVLEEVELARVRKALLVGQPHADGRSDHAGRAHARGPREPLILQRVVLAHVEVDVDRVLRDNGGEKGVARVVAAAAHEVAARHQRAADATRDRRGDAAEAQLQLRRLDAGLRNLHGSRRLAHQVLAVIEGLPRDGLALEQRSAALDVEARVADADAGLVELGFGLIECALERTRVDLEEEVAGLHLLAVGEIHLRQVAAHPRTHVHGLDGIEAARILVPFDRLAHGGLANRDLGRRKRSVGRPRCGPGRAG